MRLAGPILAVASCVIAGVRIHQDGHGFAVAYNRFLAAGCAVLALSIALPAVFIEDESTLPVAATLVLLAARALGLGLMVYAMWLGERIRAVSRHAAAVAEHEDGVLQDG